MISVLIIGNLGLSTHPDSEERMSTGTYYQKASNSSSRRETERSLGHGILGSKADELLTLAKWQNE